MVPLIVGVLVALPAFWLWALIGALSWPASTWDAAGLSRARWVLRIAILGVIGAWWYVASARQELRTAYRAVRWADREPT
ncbi:hypothetical protein GCM10022237_30220 [Nocardioides ginsengisoli]|uniref:Cardiolipin synthase N-terminal domain-containing protein n=1 Tax=Nocardioides ginsengisoli TaxID=363868 RepID=A0ABW3VWR9_9ACTN